jgi:hypothetical protein
MTDIWEGRCKTHQYIDNCQTELCLHVSASQSIISCHAKSADSKGFCSFHLALRNMFI